MAKWKCEICGSKFKNFHAQGFDNKIYCPLCFFKKENRELKEALEVKSYCKYANKCNEIYDCSREEYEDMANANMRLHVENQKLKKQLENCYCNRTDCSGRIKDSKKYDSLIQAQEVQQKEFIKFLENELLQARYYARDIAHYIEYVLRKYKEIIQTKNNNSV